MLDPPCKTCADSSADGNGAAPRGHNDDDIHAVEAVCQVSVLPTPYTQRKRTQHRFNAASTPHSSQLEEMQPVQHLRQ